MNTDDKMSCGNDSNLTSHNSVNVTGVNSNPSIISSSSQTECDANEKMLSREKTSNDFTSFVVEAQASLGIHTDRLAGSCQRHQSDQQHQAPPIMVAIRVTNRSADIAPV
jgi:transaldolase